MSISNSLNNAMSGMNVASRMAEIVSSNVANSLTEGYGRRSLGAQSGGLGGVEVGSVTRFVDRGVLADRRVADGRLGGFEFLVSTMNRVEDAVGRAGESGSISSRIVAVEAALIDAAADPSSVSRLASLSDRMTDLTDGLYTASKEVQQLRVEADTSISDQIQLLNKSLEQVDSLNDDIQRSIATGNDPSSLMDQRQVVIDKISEIVPVREIDRGRGQIALMTPTGATLLDGQPAVFGFVQNSVITPDMTLASGGLSGITINGAPIATDGLGKLTGGTLGAAFQARDVELVNAQEGLDAIAADLIERFQSPTVDPTLAAGQAGLLTDSGTAFDPLNITGLSQRIALNAAVDPAQGGVLTNFRDGINATAPGSSGDSSLLQSLRFALDEPSASGTDPTQQSAASRASNFESGIGAQRLNYDAELSFSTARWEGLKEAEAAGGVDTDYEMQMLLRVEQSFAANARVIQTVNTLMQRLMEI